MPLIRQLQQDNKIILGITKTTQLILNEEFPDLEKINIEPYNISYSKKIPLAIKLLLDVPRIFNVIKKEHQQLNDIVKEHQVNVVISDNRFGLYHKAIESIYITHQLTIQAGFFASVLNKVHHHYIKKFNTILVPDFEEESASLAGKLSKHKTFTNLQYIGPLSRLTKLTEAEEVIDFLFLLSGPEPQRTILENKLLILANNTNKKIVLVRGSSTTFKNTVSNNCTVIDLANSKELSQLILQSKTIICRSGYSTLMDLYSLQKKELILIPTPEQTEQEYLASYWQEKRGAKCVLEKDLHLLDLT